MKLVLQVTYAMCTTHVHINAISCVLIRAHLKIFLQHASDLYTICQSKRYIREIYYFYVNIKLGWCDVFKYSYVIRKCDTNL